MTQLTDEEFCEQLEKSRSTPAAPLDAEVLHLRSALTEYRTETLHWAERRSATQRSLAAAARKTERWAALPRWSLATIAIVTIAAGVAHVSEPRNSNENVTASAPAVLVQDARSSQEEIAADNRLLNSIDAELSYHGRSPVDAFDLKRPGTSVPRDSSPTASEE